MHPYRKGDRVRDAWGRPGVILWDQKSEIVTVTWDDNGVSVNVREDFVTKKYEPTVDSRQKEGD